MATASVPVRVISPRRRGAVESVREAWRHRHLVPFFGRRFVEKQYLRTWLGWVWIPLRPVLDVGARMFVFGGLFGASSEGVPYSIYLLIGMSTWELFERTAYWATRSLEVNRRFIRRIYVPRLTVLVSAIFPGLVNYAIYIVLAVITLVVVWIAQGTLYLELGPDTLLFIPGMALLLALALSVGLWLSVYGAQARDVRFSLTYVTTFWFFVTPIVLPLSKIPDKYRTIVELNPLTAPIMMVKQGLLGTQAVPALSVVSAIVAIIVVGGGGLWFFSRSEDMAVDSL